MKKIFVILLVAILMPTLAFADVWFPFGLSSDDDIQAAAEKLINALPEIRFERKGTTLYKRNTQFYIGDVTFNMITLIRNNNAVWRLVMNSEMNSTTSGNISAIYDLYKNIVEQCGEPTETSPKIIKRHFDGSSNEFSVFSNLETFTETIAQTEKKTAYVAKFGEFCTFECEVFGYGQMILSIAFENYATPETA